MLIGDLPDAGQQAGHPERLPGPQDRLPDPGARAIRQHADAGL